MTPESLIESIRVATADGATSEARTTGAAACRTLLAVLDAKPGEAIAMPSPPPQSASAITTALGALRGVPPEQLLDLVIAKLRSLVPVEAPAAQPFKLVFPTIRVPLP
jgi:hypothetical protein